MMRWPWNPQNFDGWDRHLGAPGIVGFVLMIVLWAVIIAALVLGIRALILHSRRNRASVTAAGGLPQGEATGPIESGAIPAAGTSTVLTILQERYARGEIDRDEFLQRTQDLGLS